MPTLNQFKGPKKQAVQDSKGPIGVTEAVLLGIVAALILLTFLGGLWTCLKRRRHAHKKISDRPFALRRPTAVRNPAAHNHYLKKSPSPTGIKSPTGTLGNLPVGGKTPKSVTPKTLSPNDEGYSFNTSYPGASEFGTDQRDKPTTPSKEEAELNDRNLANDGDGANRLGRLQFRLRYNSDKTALIVTVVRCSNLPSKDAPMGLCDPYVKVQLLPEKQHKAKTRVLRKTCNPYYDEEFTFYGMAFGQLQEMTLHFVILSFDRYSRDDVIGEVVAPMCQLDFGTDTSVVVNKDIQPRNLKGRGELLVSLCHQPAANRLTVVVLKARNLPKMDITGLSDPYVKIYLLWNGQRVAKKKTHVKKRTLNPVFNESFVFDLPSGAKDLSAISLEFLLLDWDRVTKNEVIGRLDLGGSVTVSNTTALHHWTEVVRSPRRQIAEWHKLRE